MDDEMTAAPVDAPECGSEHEHEPEYVYVYVYLSVCVLDDGKCDGPESSTVQKASAVAPTKAVGVICWSLSLCSSLLLQLLLLLL